MKTTQATTYRTLQTQLNRMNTRLFELRNQATTGKKVSKASDEPTSITPILQSRNRMRINDRHLNTLGAAQDKLNGTESHLSHIEGLIDEIKVTSIGSINGILTAEDRTMLADKISQIKGELLDTANIKIEGKYIFAGFKETTQPFTENPAYSPGLYDPASSATWPVQFNGDANAFNLEIGAGHALQVNVSGSAVFLGDADGNGEMDQVTITAAGNDKINFQEDPTGAGVLGAELTATLSAGTYSFASLATEIETQLEAESVASGNGIDYTVSYNTTSKKFTISGAGLDEMKILWGTGTNAATSAATTLGYLPNADAEGAATYSAYYEAPESGSVDIFAVISRLEAALRADDTTAIGAEMEGLDKGLEQVRRIRAQVGNTLTRIDTAITHLQDVDIDLQQMLSRYEDADLVEVISDMTEQESAFKAALSVIGRVSNLSILDYL